MMVHLSRSDVGINAGSAFIIYVQLMHISSSTCYMEFIRLSPNFTVVIWHPKHP